MISRPLILALMILPVLDGGELIGIISIGDCVKAVIDEQKHEIEDLRRYIAG